MLYDETTAGGGRAGLTTKKMHRMMIIHIQSCKVKNASISKYIMIEGHGAKRA